MRLGITLSADLASQCFAKINANQTTTRARARNERLIPVRKRRFTPIGCGVCAEDLVENCYGRPDPPSAPNKAKSMRRDDRVMTPRHQPRNPFGQYATTN